ncbi:MAG: hypothetical protein JOY70_06155, partial [Acidisphaera sp.]|nr:hypothetical protein [Acidisphaera sp.]
MRIAFIGNCQVQTMSLIAALMVERAETSMFDFSELYSRSDEQRARFADNLADTDLILLQPNTFSHTSHKALRERYGSRIVTIANFYFRGPFPDNCYVGPFESRLTQPTAVHSLL